MDPAKAEESVYRFAAIGAVGTITLTKNSVHVRTRSYRGRWEQTIPLEYLSPIYGTLTTAPPIYHLAWVFAILFVYAGVYALITSAAAVVRIVVGAFLLLFGLWFMWYLWRHRRTEWIMFSAHAHGCSVCYTRQGPDAESCDEFTRRLVIAIRSKPSSKTEQN